MDPVPGTSAEPNENSDNDLLLTLKMRNMTRYNGSPKALLMMTMRIRMHLMIVVMKILI